MIIFKDRITRPVIINPTQFFPMRVLHKKIGYLINNVAICFKHLCTPFLQVCEMSFLFQGLLILDAKINR